MVTSKGNLVYREDIERMSNDWKFERRHDGLAHRALTGDQQAIDQFHDVFESGNDFVVGLAVLAGVFVSASLVSNALKRRSRDRTLPSARLVKR
jgi:hypothetical protein